MYYKAMYNTSLRIVGDTMEAEDIMQESFLSAFEKIETYSGTVSFVLWLKKIVINRSLDALNRQKAIFEDIDSHRELKSLADEDDSYLDNIDVKIEAVRSAINKLPDGYRIILSLYLLEGYDHDEIVKFYQFQAVPQDHSSQGQNRSW
ncbi:MAG: sigma-70 family RNA polymerase sigma factor [Bacteroidales bacterium]